MPGDQEQERQAYQVIASDTALFALLEDLAAQQVVGGMLLLVDHQLVQISHELVDRAHDQIGWRFVTHKP